METIVHGILPKCYRNGFGYRGNPLLCSSREDERSHENGPNAARQRTKGIRWNSDACRINNRILG